MTFFDLVLSTRASLHPEVEPDEFISSYNGVIRMDCDLLVLDYIVLHPRWRGLKLGLLAARKMVDLLGGGCGLVVSHIASLRPDAHEMLRVPKSWLPRQKTAKGKKQAVLTLRRYFRQMGFERIGRTCSYGMSRARQTPTLAQLLRPSS